MAFIRNTDKFIEGSKLFFSNERAKAAVQSDLDQLASEDSAIKLRLDTIEGSGEGSIAKAKLDAQAYADQQVAALVNSAPSVLDTLKELAEALNNDASFASTVAGQIGAVDVKVDEEIERATAAEALLSGRVSTAEQDIINLQEYAHALNNSVEGSVNSLSSRLGVLEEDPVTKSYVDLLDAQKIEAIEQLDNTLIGLQEQVSQEVTNRQDADTALDYRVTALEAFPGSSESVADTLVKRNSAGAADISEMYMYTPTAGPNAEQYSFLNELEIGVFNDAEGKSAKLQSNQVRVMGEGKTSQLFAGKLTLTENGSPAFPVNAEDVVVKGYLDLTRDESEEVIFNAINSEQTRATAAEGLLDGRLEALEADPVTKTYVDEAVSGLQDQINQEVSTRMDEISEVSAGVNSAWSAINDIMPRLMSLEEDPTTKSYVDGQVSGLQGQIDTEKGRIDAILSASEADKDSFAEIVQLINSVDTSNDQAFASYVLSNDAALAQEVSDRQAGDSTLDGKIGDLTSLTISGGGSGEVFYNGAASLQIFYNTPDISTAAIYVPHGSPESAALLAMQPGTQITLQCMGESSDIDFGPYNIRMEPSLNNYSLGEHVVVVLDGPVYEDIRAALSPATAPFDLYTVTLAAVFSSGGSQTEFSSSVEAILHERQERQSAISSLESQLSQEVSDRQSAISSVEGMISAEESRAMSAESALSGRLDALESDPTTKSYVDGIQSALDARIDSLELDSVTKAYVDSSKLSDNVQSISASTSVSSSSQTQIFFCSVSGGSVTITLPSASSVAVGRKFGVKDTGSSSPSGNFITVAAQAGQTVDGQASFEMKMPFEAAQFVSDGSQWFVM